jgi:hypothetical protein
MVSIDIGLPNSGELSHLVGDCREGQREIERGWRGIRVSWRFFGWFYTPREGRSSHLAADDGRYLAEVDVHFAVRIMAHS